MLFRFFKIHRLARPVSLATTPRVSFDFLSYGYLDVSVHRVRFTDLCIQSAITPKRWVAPFGYPRITARSQLPEAFRRVPRPSSPLIAKASTRCPSLLDSHYAYVWSYQPLIPFVSFCFLQTFMFFLNSLFLILISAYKLLYLYANTFKDLIYMFSIYTRYTSYSLCPNNTLISQGYLFVSFAYRFILGGGERVRTDDP